MMKSLGIFLVCIILVTSFLIDFYTGNAEATGNFIYINDSYGRSYVNSPTSTDYWISYNDGYADNAVEAVKLAEKLMKKRPKLVLLKRLSY